ncbi:MAG: hypothetical protein ACT6RD_02285 [Brevundimonas sp.]
MNDDVEAALIQRWIIAFCEVPALIDVELMERVLSEHETTTNTP